MLFTFMGADFDNWPVFDADHMTSTYFDVKWIYMSFGPDFHQDSEPELRILIGKVFQRYEESLYKDWEVWTLSLISKVFWEILQQ